MVLLDGYILIDDRPVAAGLMVAVVVRGGVGRGGFGAVAGMLFTHFGDEMDLGSMSIAARAEGEETASRDGKA